MYIKQGILFDVFFECPTLAKCHSSSTCADSGVADWHSYITNMVCQCNTRCIEVCNTIWGHCLQPSRAPTVLVCEDFTDPCDCQGLCGWTSSGKECVSSSMGTETECFECTTMPGCVDRTCSEAAVEDASVCVPWFKSILSYLCTTVYLFWYRQNNNLKRFFYDNFGD